MTLAIFKELDERQSRMGYVACIAAVASRELDDRDTLRERFASLVFQKIVPTDDRWGASVGLIDEADLKKLQSYPSRRPALPTTRSADMPGFHYLSDLWLNQRTMPSKTGPLDPERSDVIIEHARHLGILGLGYALTERGSAVRATLPKFLLEKQRPELAPNPMNVFADPAMRAAMAYCYLGSDAVLPYLLQQVVTAGRVSHFDAGVLVRAIEAMLTTMRRIGGIADAETTREIADYMSRVSPEGPAREPTFGARGLPQALQAPAGNRKRHSAAPAKKVHRHHLRPRLEHLIDVGLLARSVPSSDDPPFQAVAATTRAATAFEELREDPRRIQGLLDTKFFGTWAEIHGPAAKPSADRTVLLQFAKAYELVKRSMGFTPGRTVALAASFLALREGVVLEVDPTMELVLNAARGPLNKYFQFSGGTRLDREFMIRVRPELRDELR